MDIVRGGREARMDYVSPWGETKRGALSKRLKSEMIYYDFFPASGAKIEKQRNEVIAEVINMPELYNANPSVFVAALYVWFQNGKRVDNRPNVSDLTIEKLESVLNIEGKPDNQLDERQLKYALKANIIRYVYAIDAYVHGSNHIVPTLEEMEREDIEDLDEMDDEREDISEPDEEDYF